MVGFYKAYRIEKMIHGGGKFMKVLGLVGEKLSHSLSPEIHRGIFKELNINGSYSLFEVSKEQSGNIGNSIRTLNIHGASVTIPYKELVLEQLDEISIEAKNIGAVNAIENKNGVLTGYNTDYYGFGRMLEKFSVNIEDKIVVILGSGGASKAVEQYIKDNRCRKLIIATRRRTSEHYSRNCEIVTYEELKEIKGDILVNTTPVGMYPNIDNSPVEKDIIKNYSTLVDIIYNPIETKFLKYGKELGKTTIDGLYMLVGQAIKAEEIWNDVIISREVEEEIYKNILNIFK